MEILPDEPSPNEMLVIQTVSELAERAHLKAISERVEKDVGDYRVVHQLLHKLSQRKLISAYEWPFEVEEFKGRFFLTPDGERMLRRWQRRRK